jgi:metallo-beta-lactamase class B
MMRTILAILVFSLIQAFSFGQAQRKKLEISHLTGDFYVFTTYRNLEGHLFPSNGMYLVTARGVVLFDTPWDTSQFQPLLDSISIKYHKKVTLCIATHFHADRRAGLSFLRARGVRTYSLKTTFDLCAKNNQNQAEFCFIQDTAFEVANHTFQTYFPGEGHSKHNMVILFENEKILYGGCLVKSTEALDLGYLGDANVK